MYKEYWKKIDKKILLLENLRCLCCNFIIEAGEEVIIEVETSKNRLLISYKTGMHKVKKSSLNKASGFRLKEII